MGCDSSCYVCRREAMTLDYEGGMERDGKGCGNIDGLASRHRRWGVRRCLT